MYRNTAACRCTIAPGPALPTLRLGSGGQRSAPQAPPREGARDGRRPSHGRGRSSLENYNSHEAPRAARGTTGAAAPRVNDGQGRARGRARVRGRRRDRRLPSPSLLCVGFGRPSPFSAETAPRWPQRLRSLLPAAARGATRTRAASAPAPLCEAASGPR